MWLFESRFEAFYFILIEQSIHEQGRRRRAHAHTAKQASKQVVKNNSTRIRRPINHRWLMRRFAPRTKAGWPRSPCAIPPPSSDDEWRRNQKRMHHTCLQADCPRQTVVVLVHPSCSDYSFDSTTDGFLLQKSSSSLVQTDWDDSLNRWSISGCCCCCFLFFFEFLGFACTAPQIIKTRVKLKLN